MRDRFVGKMVRAMLRDTREIVAGQVSGDQGRSAAASSARYDKALTVVKSGKHNDRVRQAMRRGERREERRQGW